MKLNIISPQISQRTQIFSHLLILKTLLSVEFVKSVGTKKSI